jgi:hypothetical protein
MTQFRVLRTTSRDLSYNPRNPWKNVHVTSSFRLRIEAGATVCVIKLSS